MGEPLPVHGLAGRAEAVAREWTAAGFASVASRLSAADASLMHVVAQLYDDDAMKDLRRIPEADVDPVSAGIDARPPRRGRGDPAAARRGARADPRAAPGRLPLAE